jgi:hypothetical protein
VSTTVLPQRPGTGRGLRSTTQLLDVNAELGVATVKVDLGEVTDATVHVGVGASLGANALIGLVFAERLLEWTSVHPPAAVRGMAHQFALTNLSSPPPRRRWVALLR